MRPVALYLQAQAQAQAGIVASLLPYTSLRVWKLLGFEFLVNNSRAFRKFWEFYLCFVIRGKALVFEFEVM